MRRVRLKPRFDPAGVLWFDNHVMTYLRWFERWYNPPEQPLLSPKGVLALLFTLALWGLAIVEWSQGVPLSDPLTWLFLLMSVWVALFSYHRRRHPLFHPAAPVHVGFTPAELLWQSQDGRIDRRPWSSLSDARIERDEAGGLLVTLRNSQACVLRSLNPDLAIKIGWAWRAARRGLLDISSLARPVNPVRAW